MRNPIAHLDHSLSRSGRLSPPGVAGHLLAKAVSPWGATVQGLAAAVALRASGRPWVPVALTPPAAASLAKVLKWLTSRSRPGISRFEKKGRQSFPSSHVAGPAALFASLYFVAPRTKPWFVVLALGTAMTVTAAVERVCAARHWPTDVLAGAALGAAIGTAVGRAASSRAKARHAAPEAALP
jgi:membrane-associated phospholipid phosphatase